MKKTKKDFNFSNLLRLTLVVVLAGFVIAFTGCDEEDGDEPNPLVGVYQISAASLAEDTPGPIQVAPDSSASLDAGTDVLAIVGGAFAGAASCPPANTAISLADNFDFEYICQGSGDDPMNAGTWNNNEEIKVISINLNATSFGVALTVKVTNYQLSGNTLTGTIEDFPFSDLDGNPVFTDVDITFNKVE